MKLLRKRDIFTHFDAYLDGELTIGECIDECETLDLSDLIIELEEIKNMTYKEDRQERLEKVIAELKKWGWDE